ncbi:MAG: ABC transporter permease [Bryobacterales bacterium]|nr:ABC transporter permease [Bryobacterales bacterium]
MRTAIRRLLRAPAFTASAILTIGLGIGGNVAVFTVLQQVLLDPLPYRDPGRLVHIGQTHPDYPATQVSAPDFFDWQKMARSYSNIAAHTFQAMNKWRMRGDDGQMHDVHIVQASAGMYPMLGVQPLMGRFYTPEEERGKQPVVVISESLWRHRLNGDAKVIGRQIRLMDWPVTVVGVVRQAEVLPSWGEVWMGLGFLDIALTESRRFHALEVIARLKPGVSREAAQAEMTAIARALAERHPDMNSRFGAAVNPLAGWITREAGPTLMIAAAAVSLVLLLACGNVAHLVLVRTVGRTSEFAVRFALGASALRVVRLVLAENVAVAVAGGVVGAVLAAAALPLLLRLAPEIPRLAATSVSPGAIGAGLLATVAVAVFVALPSVFHALHADLHQASKRRRSGFGRWLVAAELALGLAVIATAALLGRSYAMLLREDPGFQAQGVLAVDWSEYRPDWKASESAFRQQIEPALRALPGVVAVAAVNVAPQALRPSETNRFASRFEVAGEAKRDAGTAVAQMRWVTPDYFATLGIPLRTGRLLEERDYGQDRLLVNEALARRYFAGRSPVGRKIVMNAGTSHPKEVEVVGVVGDVRDLGLETSPQPVIYSLNVSTKMTILVRGKAAAHEVSAAIRSVAPNAVIRMHGALDNLRRESLALRSFSLMLLTVFAVLAGVLTMVGVYGVMSYTLRLQARDFAIRFALGAQPGAVRVALVREFAGPVGVGLLAGTWLAVSAAGMLRVQLYQMTPADPWALIGTAVLLVAMLIVAALRPVARTAAISPAALLRQ